jgi:hypothetical protein
MSGVTMGVLERTIAALIGEDDAALDEEELENALIADKWFMLRIVLLVVIKENIERVLNINFQFHIHI